MILSDSRDHTAYISNCGTLVRRLLMTHHRSWRTAVISSRHRQASYQNWTSSVPFTATHSIKLLTLFQTLVSMQSKGIVIDCSHNHVIIQYEYYLSQQRISVYLSNCINKNIHVFFIIHFTEISQILTPAYIDGMINYMFVHCLFNVYREIITIKLKI